MNVSISHTLVAFCITLPSLSWGAPTSTVSGNELAISLSSYRYEEPGLMSLQGMKTGIDLRMTRDAARKGSFFRTELRYAGGMVDYNSKDTGSMQGEPDWYVEARLLFGNDHPQARALLSSYIGLGYRFLLNDGRGISTTNAAGYRRESNYLYLPIGITHISDLRDGATLKLMLEYDHLLSGHQFSRLSDTGLGYTDLNNKQSSGYGIKARLTYTTREWSAGPYIHYWNIAASESQPLYRYGSYVGYGIEPNNKTSELGIEFSRPF